jgi:hypothetical protein
MSGTIIKTKFSLVNAQPASNALQQGEQAYSYISNKMWIGWDNGGVIDPIAIGGKFYTDQLKASSVDFGKTIASHAIITDSANKIDLINIDNITIDGNTITTTNTNGDLTVNPNGTGSLNIQANTDVVGNLTVSGTSTFTGQTTLASLNVTDLTSGRVVLAGTSGEIEDSGNLTFTGSLLTLTGNEAITGTLDVNGQSTLASLNVEDLTATRLTFAGTSGELVDSGNLIFDGSKLTITGNEQITGTLNVDSQATLASLNVEDLTSTRVTFAGTSGELTDSANFTWASNTLTIAGSAAVDNVRIDGNTISAIDANGALTITPSGTGVVTIDTTTGLIVASGSEASRPAPGVIGNGAIRYNQTSNRFEGTVSGSWTGLGGVVDIDQDTYIVAEEAADEDVLRFYAAGTQEMTVDALGVTVTDQITTPIANITTDNVTTANIGTANITTQLQVDADANFTVGIDVLSGDVDITDNLNVQGNAVIDGNLTVNGTTTSVNSTVTTLNDPVIKVGDGSTVAVDLIDRGVNFDYGDGTSVKTGFFGFDNATNRFSYKPIVNTTDEDYDAPWGDAQFGQLFLSGDATFANNLVLSSNTISITAGDLTITPAGGDTTITGNVQITTDLVVNGNVTFDNDVPITSGGTGMSSFTGNGIFISNGAGTSLTFVTGSLYDIVQFNASGVPVASNIIDGGTF